MVKEHEKANSQDIEKGSGKKDLSKLVKKVVIDKTGKRTTVYVKPTEQKKFHEHGGVEDLNFNLFKKIKRKGKGKGGEIDLTEKEVATILEHGKVGFISAGVNPADPNDVKLTEKKVEERYSKLKDELSDKGYMYVRVRGKYGEEEDSFMVMVNDVDRKDIQAMGTAYNQDSIIYSDHGRNEMIFTTGENKYKKHVGDGFNKLGDEVSDFYSEISTPKGKVKFSLNFNFDQLTKAYMENIKKGFGKKDLSKLTKKTVIDKTGQKRTVWVKLGEAVGDAKHKVEDTVEGGKKKLKDWAGKQEKQYKDSDGDGKDDKTGKTKKEMSSKEESPNQWMEEDGTPTKESTDTMAGWMKKKGKGILKGLKEEVHEWKEAGSGIKKLATGMQMNDHEKKAIRDVAIHMGMVVAMATMGGDAGESAIAAKAALMAKKVGLGYLEHAGILRAGHALLFAKAISQLDDEEAEHYLERMQHSMTKYMENYHELEGSKSEKK